MSRTRSHFLRNVIRRSLSVFFNPTSFMTLPPLLLVCCRRIVLFADNRPLNQIIRSYRLRWPGHISWLFRELHALTMVRRPHEAPRVPMFRLVEEQGRIFHCRKRTCSLLECQNVTTLRQPMHYNADSIWLPRRHTVPRKSTYPILLVDK